MREVFKKKMTGNIVGSVVHGTIIAVMLLFLLLINKIDLLFRLRFACQVRPRQSDTYQKVHLHK